jgi:hypothetical protein
VLTFTEEDWCWNILISRPGPRLNFLDVCELTDEAVSALSRCTKLRYLRIRWSDGLNDVLRAIGVNLVGLDLWDATAATCLVIAENCPNLEYLEMSGDYSMVVMVGFLKDGLKKFLKVNDESVRLGTDWMGYLEY